MAALDAAWDGTLEADRLRLVHFCARVTGDAAAAEDLAQEALLEGWRARGRLRDPEARGRWLTAIARRVCWRWRRARGAERAVPAGAEEASDPAASVDIEAELEQAELLELLDRALALLPADTRRILIERYVREAPHAEIAGRLGLSEGAVTMRAQRGKALLRHLLLTRFRDEARAFGLAQDVADGWERTRIWCPNCGARRLWGHWGPGRRPILECRGCRGHDRVVIIHGWTGELYWGPTCAEVLAGVQGWKPACNRLAAANFAAYRDGVRGIRARCCWCLRPAPVHVSDCGDVRTLCAHCGGDNGISASSGVAFCHPVMQGFWRRHGRIRPLPELHVEAAGMAAVVYRVESVGDASTAAVALERDSLLPIPLG